MSTPADGRWALRLAPGEVADLPELWQGDVVVVGGGSAGCAATVAAARAGARTLVVERAGFLGGIGAGVLDTFYGFYAPGAVDRRVVGGIAWEVADTMLSAGQAFERPNTYGAGTGVTYEPDVLRGVWDDFVAAAGADVLLHTLVTRVVMSGDRVEGLVVETGRGPALVRATAVVDASGAAEVAWRAGAAVELPEPGRRLQPLTATFRMAGVDVDRTSSTELHARLAEADDASYRLPRKEGSAHRTVLPGVVHTNLTRVSGVDPTDAFELSAAEREGRRQVREYARFLVDQVPGYERAALMSTPDRIGVRESRRLLGRYVLAREDVMAARDFTDAIARCGAPLEDHDGGEATVWEYIGGDTPSGATYGVPYRCLLPAEVGGLLVAGRCLSATHDAHASVRSMAQCMAMGEAAGTAAALAAHHGVEPGELDPDELRATLTTNGALL